MNGDHLVWDPVRGRFVARPNAPASAPAPQTLRWQRRRRAAPTIDWVLAGAGSAAVLVFLLILRSL